MVWYVALFTGLVFPSIYPTKLYYSQVSNGMPKFQAQFRRRQQVEKYANLLKQRNERIAAQTVQKAFKDCKWNRYYGGRLKEHQLRRRAIKAAMTIQRCYRGHIGKLIASDHKRMYESKILQEKKYNAKCLCAATFIQRIARGNQARSLSREMQLSSEISRREQTRRVYSTITLQRMARGLIGRVTVRRLWREYDLTEERWYRARQIQCAYRVAIARMMFKRLCYLKKIKTHHREALKLQSLWRSRVARKRVKMIRGLSNLRRLERFSCIQIQRAYRGMKGRMVSRERKSKLREAQMQWNAAIFIQKLYRGYKGREEAFVEMHLEANKWKARPLRSQIKEHGENISTAETSLFESKQHEQEESFILDEMIKELKTISASPNDYVDSTIVNGVLQRCTKSLVTVSVKSVAFKPLNLHRNSLTNCEYFSLLYRMKYQKCKIEWR